jgi:hypothetical protein
MWTVPSALTVQPGCDPLITRFNPTSWRIDQNELVLIGVKGDTIVAIDPHLVAGSARVIDASGLVVSPDDNIRAALAEKLLSSKVTHYSSGEAG